jgi:hypothetical protein
MISIGPAGVWDDGPLIHVRDGVRHVKEVRLGPGAGRGRQGGRPGPRPPQHPGVPHR